MRGGWTGKKARLGEALGLQDPADVGLPGKGDM